MTRSPARLRLLLPIFLLLASVAPAGAQTTVEETGADGLPGEPGEDASAGGVEVRSGAEPVDLEVLVQAGDGGPATDGGEAAGDGGEAGLRTTYGASDTGDVRVLGAAQGGAGGDGSETAAAGDGGAVHLRNVVDGDTAGALSLTQRAVGGDAGLAAPGLIGDGAAASSHLSRAKSAASLEVRADALAGGGLLQLLGTHGIASPFAGPGAPAAASAGAHNDAGPAAAFAISRGGIGGSADAEGPALPGGDAQAWATASTRGDGQAVRVGNADLDPFEPGFQALSAAAVAGPGGSFQRAVRGTLGGPLRPDGPRAPLDTEAVNVPGGAGGDASSFSLGFARGRSPVEVHDAAVGGSGGAQLATFTSLDGLPGLAFYEDVGAGRGGDARSVAVGLGGRGEPLRVVADATAGPGSPVTLVDSPDGPLLDPGVIHIVGERPAPVEGGGSSNQFVPTRSSFFLGEFGEVGGAAHARAQAVGSGPVEVDARARGGAGSVWRSPYTRLRHEGGPAHARAAGAGAGGRVRAEAASNAPTLGVTLSAESGLLRAARAEARIDPSALDERRRGIRGLRRGSPRPDAAARAVVAPTATRSGAALAGAPDVVAALAEATEPDRPVLGRLSSRQRQWGWGTPVETTWQLELRSERDPDRDPVEQYRLALLSPRLSRWGFVSLHVTLEKEGVVLAEASFSDPAVARAYLDGAVLEVGTLAGVAVPSPLPPGFPGVELFPIRRSEVATLTVELVTDRPGAGLKVDFLVSRTPLPPAP